MNKDDYNGDKDSISAAAARWVARRDAGLTAAEEVEFERWLAEDAQHGAALQHFSTAWSFFDRPRRSGTTTAVVLEIAGRVRRRRRRRVWMAAAASTMLMLTALVWQWPRPAAEPNAPLLASGAVFLQPEQRVLPDGSIMDLQGGTEIAVAYDAAFRRVALRSGEAHFEVAKDPMRPFIVAANGVEVRAVGTSFLVQVVHTTVEVLVTEGQVAVERPVMPSAVPEEDKGGGHVTPTAPQMLGLLQAGNRMVVDPADSEAVLPRVQSVGSDELAERLAWRSRRLEFSGTPLGEAVALMNRSATGSPGAARVRLVLDPSSGLGLEPVSGIFRADSAEAFVRVLELSLGVQVERRENEIILRKTK